MLNNEDIICISLTDWDTEMVSNRYQIMTRFAKQNRVFFFERPLGIISLLLSRNILKNITKVFRGPIKRRDNLFTIMPFKFPSMKYLAFTRILNMLIYQSYIKLVTKKWKITNPILWFYNYEASNLISTISCKAAIYHCTEDHDRISQYWTKYHNLVNVKEQEEQMIRKANIVFAVSDHLAEKCKSYNNNSYPILNAVDYELYKQAQEKHNLPGDWPKNLKTEKKRLGYIGNISQKVNITLLLEVAMRFRDFNLMIVGPVMGVDRETWQSLLRCSNVFYFDRQPVEKLPIFLSFIDVCLIPFIQDEWFVKASQPLKLFEYLASGKPIVTTSLLAINKYEKYIYISNNTEEFIGNIAQALKEDETGELSKERTLIAKNNTWDMRFKNMNEIIESYLISKE